MNAIELVRENDCVTLTRHLTNNRQKVNLEIVDNYGNTPLLLACYLGFTKFIPLLLQFDVNLRAINYFGQNALTLATFSNSVDIINILLQYRTYKDFILSSMVPPLSVAVLCGHVKLINLFTKMESDPQNVKTVHGVTVKELVTHKKLYKKMLKKSPKKCDKIDNWHHLHKVFKN